MALQSESVLSLLLEEKKKGIFVLIDRTPARLLPASPSSESTFQGLGSPQDSGEEKLLHLQALSAVEVRRGKALEGCTPQQRSLFLICSGKGAGGKQLL